MSDRTAIEHPGFWRDRPVLVTGAAGLLGSWLVARLPRQGARVVVAWSRSLVGHGDEAIPA